MTSQQIERLVESALNSFKVEMPDPGSTIGRPWDCAKVDLYVAKLKDALVTPYRRRFELGDTYEQSRKSPPDEADYWVVAETRYYLEFYDPSAKEFGLADRGTDKALPKTIGVRGELIFVFCAM